MTDHEERLIRLEKARRKFEEDIMKPLVDQSFYALIEHGHIPASEEIIMADNELTVEKLLEAKRILEESAVPSDARFLNYESNEIELNIDKFLDGMCSDMRDPARQLDFPNDFSGIQVRVLHPYEKKRRRTWKERLFSFPWEPLEKYETEWLHSIDKGTMLYYKNDGVMFVRPDDYERIKSIA